LDQLVKAVEAQGVNFQAGHAGGTYAFVGADLARTVCPPRERRRRALVDVEQLRTSRSRLS